MMKRLTVRMTEEEHDLVSTKALLANKSVNSFLVENAKTPVILDIDYDAIEENTKTLTGIKNDIGLILHTAIQTGDVYQNDIINVLKILDEVVKSQKELYKTLEKDRKKKDILIKNTVKKEIDKRLGK